MQDQAATKTKYTQFYTCDKDRHGDGQAKRFDHKEDWYVPVLAQLTVLVLTQRASVL